MRTEDLRGIPEYVTFAQRNELLATLGFTELNDVHEVKLTPFGIEAEIWATDNRGRYFTSRDEAAAHRISIPIISDPEESLQRTTIETDMPATNTGGDDG